MSGDDAPPSAEDVVDQVAQQRLRQIIDNVHNRADWDERKSNQAHDQRHSPRNKRHTTPSNA